MRASILKLIIATWIGLGLMFAPLATYAQSTVIRTLKSGFWEGGVRANAQGKASYCYLLGQKSNDEFTIQIYWNRQGFHLLIYSKNWTLDKGHKFQGRVSIDRKFSELVDASVFDSESIDYLFGFDNNAIAAFKSGSRITMEGPAGQRTFRLNGTRKALDVLQACANEYLTPNEGPTKNLGTAETNTEVPDYNKGIRAYKAKDYRLALNEFRPLASSGNAKAQNRLGIMYAKGEGVDKDYELSANWFRKAADQGHVNAKANLKQILSRISAETGQTDTTVDIPSNGNPVVPSFADELVTRALDIIAGTEDGSLEDAYNLVDKAADLGDRRGQWMAGRMAISGVGTDANRTTGLARILVAAEAGHPEALTYMGLHYLQDGNAATDETGMAYLERAADQGHAPAISALVFFEQEAN